MAMLFQVLRFVASALPVVLLALAIHTVLHELGHALAARAVRFEILGIQWNLAVPGVIISDGVPEGAPGPRLRWTAVHLAGVAANLAVALAAAQLAGLSLAGALARTFAPGASLPAALAGVGLVVALVNLVPAPLFDGGRLILALTTGHAGPRLRTVETALWVFAAGLALGFIMAAVPRIL